MRLSELRLPFAGVLLLAASGLTFAFATNGTSESPGAVERPAIAVATPVTVVSRGEDDRHAVTPAATRPAVAHRVAAPAVRAPGPSRRHVAARPRPRTAGNVAKAPVKRVIALAQPKRATLPRPAIAWQPFSIVRFSGSKRTIARGDSVTLCARATGAAHLRIVPLGPVDPLRRTCRVVRPRKTTTYTLLAQGPGGGEMTQNVTIAVRKRTVPSRQATQPLDHDPGL